MSGPRHFLDLSELSSETLRSIVDRGVALRSAGARSGKKPHAGRVLAMIFEKPSTRTRVSFDVAMFQLGGHAVGLSSDETQIGRGETVADTARVLSRYVDAVMIRAGAHQRLLDLAANADVPVINGLTDFSHPCQLLADVMTFEQHRGAIAGRVVAWSGDGNNVATSWIHAAVRFGFELRLACPPSRGPDAEVLAWAAAEGSAVTLTDDAAQAVNGADCVVTDTWVSMGDKDSAAIKTLLAPYRVDAALMGGAKPDALFMHCLPAHRGDEVTAEVIDGPHSVVWDGAENRLHAQKGILDWCFAG